MDEIYRSRTLEDAVLDASAQFPAVLVTGPRQVGKTTILRHMSQPSRRYASLDDLSLRELAVGDAGLFLQRFPPPVLIDEIQYAPDLLPQIKLRIDDDRQPGAFWLTGSQRFQLMRRVSESLAGRVATLQLLGFSSRERQGRACDIPPFLPTEGILAERLRSRGTSSLGEVFADIWLGAFPALATAAITNRDLFYASYLETYLLRDVSDLAQVGDRSAFVRFVRCCAARTGQLLNLADLARDADVSAPTARRWLSILEASFQIALVQPYHTNITKRLVKAPKLYFLDTGLCGYLTEWSSPETLATGAMAGAIFETHVVVEILKSWWHRGRTPQVYYYRDKDAKEIDLLFFADGRLHPVEIKLGATPRREWVRHFSVLERLGARIGEGAVVCLTPEPVPLTEKVTALPVGAI